MAQTITFPGTNTKIPMWAVLVAGAAGLFAFLQVGGKGNDETTAEDFDPTSLLSSQLSQQLNDFGALIQDQISNLNNGSVTPPVTPPQIMPPLKQPPIFLGPPMPLKQPPIFLGPPISLKQPPIFLGPPIPKVEGTSLYNKQTGKTTTLYLQNLKGLQGKSFEDKNENIDLPPLETM